MATFGGILKFRLPDGRNLSVRGSVTHMPGRSTFEKIANYDGSLDRSQKPEGYEASLAFSNRDTDGIVIDWDAVMALEGVNVTLLSDAERVDRTFSDGFFFGRPSIDDLTGEITGVQFAATDYAAVRR